MPKIIHILLSVIDHLGDIGFACELVRGFHERYPGRYIFSIWTDNVEQTNRFFEVNKTVVGSYQIGKKTEFTMKPRDILFLLFHHPLPKKMPEKDIFTLRIDYLSFDHEWTKNHGKEHIESTAQRNIIEIIPSPLQGSGGLIPPPKEFMSRDALARKFGLDLKKRWVSIFAYSKTLKDGLILDEIEGTEILIFGKDLSTSTIVSARDDKISPTSYLLPPTSSLPFLSLMEFSSLVKESEWAVMRGEVSLISTLQIGVPLMWDMYQEIGGFHREQAEQFLDWIEADESYKDIFDRLNGQKEGKVKLSEIDTYFANNKWKVREMEANLVEEIEKYIDTFENSL